jgi:hypothetical protein
VVGSRSGLALFNLVIAGMWVFGWLLVCFSVQVWFEDLIGSRRGGSTGFGFGRGLEQSMGQHVVSISRHLMKEFDWFCGLLTVF